ncbi:sugar phosphate isomerase/epimerase [Halioglobus maricola]|uniref:Sugar phosphate isomerase/epimerase n=1 Tax=Halioglobus maricola TaxID=2601894 RepID=A0A5P9NNQ5_9GAMM|nr:sugar phosphate isomerase/epimerase [Halioglobus maricola]QFU77417.1 sugar phosphate isomerase/epimerase [Halioglobus maricola]
MDVRIGMDMRLWGDSVGVAELPQLEMLASLGYAGVEIPLSGQGTSELKLLRVALADLGLVALANTVIPAGSNPIDSSLAVRRRAVDYLKARVDDTAQLGSKVLCGGLFQAQGQLSGVPPTDREWDWSRRCLREVGEHAASCDVKLALEFQSRFDAHLVNTAADASRMCEDIDLENLGVLYNTFHAHLEEFNPARALPAAGERLMLVHLSESHRGELGRGQVQWQETFATLDFLDYHGWLVVQARGLASSGDAVPANIWREQFDSREQLSTDAIALIQHALRLQRQ